MDHRRRLPDCRAVREVRHLSRFIRNFLTVALFVHFEYGVRFDWTNWRCYVIALFHFVFAYYLVRLMWWTVTDKGAGR